MRRLANPESSLRTRECLKTELDGELWSTNVVIAIRNDM